MRTTEENIKLADLLFPNVKEKPEDVSKKFPSRNLDPQQMVLRFAPSPTGFLHIGSVYTGLLCTLLAKQSGGISILRIEDTDKNREVENGISLIVDGLKGFGIEFDEGPKSERNSVGKYGPYIQSRRLDMYSVFAKDLVSKGYAYPCFITSEELEEIRAIQIQKNVRTGYYGEWAKWRNARMSDIEKMLEEKREFAIRLYSTGKMDDTFELNDMVKGRVTLRKNDMDAVLLKSDGYPTYHFAHPIDDTLMGVTHVTRADEWFASLPLHIEIFEKLGFKALPYGHLSPLMKLDNDGRSKRKLSKRKDPEADVQYYIGHGYPKEGVLEYMLNLANSNFYDWRKQNPSKESKEFVLKFEKFNKAGSLFDVVKLNDMCKDYIATLSASKVYSATSDWAMQYNDRLYKILKENREYCIKILNIEREGDKIRKDLCKFEDVQDQFTIFFDEFYKKEKMEDISDKVSKENQSHIIEEYLKVFNIDDDIEVWFGKIKEVASKLGYASNRKEYEESPEKYLGMVGDVATVIRVAVTKRTRTPDLYQVIQVLGRERVVERLEEFLSQMV